MVKILIPPPRIPIIDSRTGLMSSAWYAFFAQFLQGVGDDVVGLTGDVGGLATRLLTAENDVDDLFVDHAMAVPPIALIDGLRKRITELETDLSMVSSPLAAIEELRKRVADIETDLEMGL